jgi:hypothetical protein
MLAEDEDRGRMELARASAARFWSYAIECSTIGARANTRADTEERSSLLGLPPGDMRVRAASAR